MNLNYKSIGMMPMSQFKPRPQSNNHDNISFQFLETQFKDKNQMAKLSMVKQNSRLANCKKALLILN
jgi:hypothetical protein